MNKYIKIFVASYFALALSSCNFLDPQELSLIDEEDIYRNINYVNQSVVSAYSYLPDGFASVENSLLACTTDEAESVKPESVIQKYNSGNWNKYSNPEQRWVTCYNGIRQCCEVLEGIEGDIWQQLEFDDPVEYASRTELMKRYCNEMRFLRAYYYFELIKRYGGVPIITRKLDPNSAEDLYILQHTKRNSFEECVNYILSECDVVASDEGLPLEYTDSNLGRPTRGVALALKSRVALLAASDLYNQESNTNELIGYVGGSQSERYLRAAQAAQAVIDLGLYSLNASYQSLFTMDASLNSAEVIWSRRLPASKSMESINYPISYDIGGTETCPSQNLVDAYEMTDGSVFDWNNPAHAQNPYENRDPRLKMSIITNNEQWGERNVEIWEGGLDGLPIQYATRTGYYLKKFLREGMNLNSQNVTRQWLFFRYAEILLNYAEAANEYGGAGFMVDGALSPLTPEDAINLIRGRSDVAMPDVASTISARGEVLDKSTMRALIKNERRVELVFEDFRWMDARRWFEGDAIIGATIRGVRIQMQSNDTFEYTPFEVEDREFNVRDYFYPIDESEVVRSNGEMIQNPGW